jgi:uncharacterized protein (TIGR03067 family)
MSEVRIPTNFIRSGSLALLVCLLAGCRALSTGNSADDTKKIQGTWKLVGSTYNGGPQMADMEWIIDGDHYTIRLDGQQHRDPYFFKLDASRKQIDVFHHETPPGTYGGKLKEHLRDRPRFSGRFLKGVFRPDRRAIPEIFRCKSRLPAVGLRISAGMTARV